MMGITMVGIIAIAGKFPFHNVKLNSHSDWNLEFEKDIIILIHRPTDPWVYYGLAIGFGVLLIAFMIWGCVYWFHIRRTRVYGGAGDVVVVDDGYYGYGMFCHEVNMLCMCHSKYEFLVNMYNGR